jgi:hypothetical protein
VDYRNPSFLPSQTTARLLNLAALPTTNGPAILAFRDGHRDLVGATGIRADARKNVCSTARNNLNGIRYADHPQMGAK